jgi:hypothetical protein
VNLYRIISIRQAQRMLHVEDSLDIGKIYLDLYEYQKGAGTESNVEFYLDAGIARAIVHDLAWHHKHLDGVTNLTHRNTGASPPSGQRRYSHREGVP